MGISGVHDLGGETGFGPIDWDVPEDAGPFKEAWEGRVVGNLFCMMGAKICMPDMVRAAIESMPPEDYRDATYYEKWLTAVTNILIMRGLITEEGLAERMAELEAEGS